MKKYISMFLIFCMCALTVMGCAESKNINGKIVEPYGFFNKEDKDPNVKYKMSTGTVVVSIIFCETIVVPVIGLGLKLYEPVSAIDTVKVK